MNYYHPYQYLCFWYNSRTNELFIKSKTQVLLEGGLSLSSYATPLVNTSSEIKLYSVNDSFNSEPYLKDVETLFLIEGELPVIPFDAVNENVKYVDSVRRIVNEHYALNKVIEYSVAARVFMLDYTEGGSVTNTIKKTDPIEID